MTKQELVSLAKTAREQRLEGNHYDADSQFPLSGYCFDNTFVLYSLLVDSGYSPSIVAGLAESYAQSLLQETSVSELNVVEDLAGFVHFWVECDGFVIDIAPESEKYRGEVYVSESLPETYHRLEDSYEYAQEVLDDDARERRCAYCGGRYRYCECPNAAK